MSNRPRFPWVTDVALPLFVAGCGVMGFNWPYYAGPALIGLGLLIFVLRFSFWLQAAQGARSGGYMKPLDVIMYIGGQSAWGERTRRFRQVRPDGTVWKKNPELEAFGEFQRQAQMPENEIKAFGLLHGRGSPVEISHSFWLANGLDITETLNGRAKTAPYPQRGDVHFLGHAPDFYTAVSIQRRGVTRAWPRMGPVARIKRRLRLWKEAQTHPNLPPEPPAPVAAEPAPVAAEPAPAAPPASRPAKAGSPNYPYRKAVLQMDPPKRSGSANQRGDLESTECTMIIRNESSVALKKCSVHLIDLGVGDDLGILDEPLRADTFALHPGGKKHIRFIRRDLKDIISNPPHLLKITGGDISLDEGVTYILRLELRSEYEFPTLVTMALKVEREYVTATIESQTV